MTQHLDGLDSTVKHIPRESPEPASPYRFDVAQILCPDTRGLVESLDCIASVPQRTSQ